MARLVDDLLLLAHADERTQVLKQIDVDLDDIIYAEADRIRTISGVAVRVSVTAVRVTGDPQALSRLVRNLWTTPSGTHVTRFVSNAGRWMVTRRSLSPMTGREYLWQIA